ncbi:hypothetical protein TNCV_1419221 [Trichonephila clavipes]|nr:hypothetical protein TNCV_1419221 [Trichonephila clavipes]
MYLYIFSLYVIRRGRLPGHDGRCRVGYVQWTTSPPVLSVEQSTLTSPPPECPTKRTHGKICGRTGCRVILRGDYARHIEAYDRRILKKIGYSSDGLVNQHPSNVRTLSTDTFKLHQLRYLTSLQWNRDSLEAQTANIRSNDNLVSVIVK